jgi:hypothetical protein
MLEDIMNELVLDIITSYENRISMVEEAFSTACHVTLASDDTLSEVEQQRERLTANLQETLARNCSVRRKDFNELMERILADSKIGRKRIEEQRERIESKLADYLKGQRRLVGSLRERLVNSTNKEGLAAVVADLKRAYNDKGEKVLGMLRDFQEQLEAFRCKQEKINNKLQRLSERGETLKLDDLRQLEAVKAHEDRKVDRKLRRRQVERLLVHFGHQRRSGRSPRAQKNPNKGGT